MLGTAITQTFPRHPIAVAQQVLTLAQLAPNRFRLGLGTSGQGGVEQMLGINFRAPLGHLKEYVLILKALLQEGSVDYSGRYYQAHTSIPAPVEVPRDGCRAGRGSVRDVWGRNRRRHKLGVSGGVPAGCGLAGHVSWSRTGRSRHAPSDSTRARLRSRRPRGGPPSHRGAIQGLRPRAPSTAICSTTPAFPKYQKACGVPEWWTPSRCQGTRSR